MPYLTQFFVHRELTPAQGQWMLNQIVREVDKNPTHWNPGAVKIPGINRFENPFPQWLQETFVQYGFVYDSINLCYAGPFPTEAEAEKWRTWFDNSVRPWAAQRGLDTSTVHARVMCEHPDVDALTAY
jgi:hypothetical protein